MSDIFELASELEVGAERRLKNTTTWLWELVYGRTSLLFLLASQTSMIQRLLFTL